MPSGNLGVIIPGQEAAAELYRAGFRGVDLLTMLAIWMGESGLDATAHNPGRPGYPENSWGPAQINLLAHPSITMEQAVDPRTAAEYSYFLYTSRGGGFGDWSVYTSGAYRANLGAAAGAVAEMVQNGIVGVAQDTLDRINAALGIQLGGDGSDPHPPPRPGPSPSPSPSPAPGPFPIPLPNPGDLNPFRGLNDFIAWLGLNGYKLAIRVTLVLIGAAVLLLGVQQLAKAL